MTRLLITPQDNHDQISIEYSNLDAGGQITYVADESDIIDAIHTWFGAQLADHGDHATDTR